MNRREFVKTAGGATAVASATTAAAATPSVAQEGGNETETPSGNETGTPSGNESAAGGGGGGGTQTVTVGPGSELRFDPEELTIEPGTTVVWEWDSDGHNVVPDSIPSDASWEGHEPIENAGFTYQHTFDVEGTYDYVCTPHEQAGMVGSIQVGGNQGGGGGGEVDPEHMGVPIQAHFVGLATILAIMVSLVFTFFQLKYGESPHASGGNR
jgi:plastocyanin